MTTIEQQLAASRMLTARLHVACKSALEHFEREIADDHTLVDSDFGPAYRLCKEALSHNEPEILALLADVERASKVERLAAAAAAVVAQNNDVLRDTMPDTHQAIRELGYASDALR